MPLDAIDADANVKRNASTNTNASELLTAGTSEVATANSNNAIATSTSTSTAASRRSRRRNARLPSLPSSRSAEESVIAHARIDEEDSNEELKNTRQDQQQKQEFKSTNTSDVEDHIKEKKSSTSIVQSSMEQVLEYMVENYGVSANEISMGQQEEQRCSSREEGEHDAKSYDVKEEGDSNLVEQHSTSIKEGASDAEGGNTKAENNTCPQLLTIDPWQNLHLVPCNTTIDFRVHQMCPAKTAMNWLKARLNSNLFWNQALCGSRDNAYANEIERLSDLARLDHSLSMNVLTQYYDSTNQWKGESTARFEAAFLVHYPTPGGHWSEHFSDHLRSKNPRRRCIILFLNDLTPMEGETESAGGELRFPSLSCQITPRAGWCVSFNVSDAEGSRLDDSAFEVMPLKSTKPMFCVCTYSHINAESQGDFMEVP